LARAFAVGLRETLAFLQPRLAALGHAASRHRHSLYDFGDRVAWWGALALVAVAGRDLLSAFTSNEAFERAPYLLAAATLVCAATVYRTRGRSVRVGAAMLGSGAGALGLFGWLIQVS
jgi:hypothetical protein